MAKKVLSMEIGQATTRVIEIDYMAKAPKIYQAFSLETPRDMVQDSTIPTMKECVTSVRYNETIPSWEEYLATKGNKCDRTLAVASAH